MIYKHALALPADTGSARGGVPVVTVSPRDFVACISDRTGSRIDFGRIWSRQAASPELRDLVKVWAPQINSALRTSAGQRKPSDWYKKEDCWIELHGSLLSLIEPLSPELPYSNMSAKAELDTVSVTISVWRL